MIAHEASCTLDDVDTLENAMSSARRRLEVAQELVDNGIQDVSEGNAARTGARLEVLTELLEGALETLDVRPYRMRRAARATPAD